MNEIADRPDQPADVSRTVPHGVLGPIGLFVAYFLESELGYWLAADNEVGVAFWPPAGIGLAALLIAPLGTWRWLILAAGSADFASNLLHAQPVLATVGFGLANLTEITLGATIIRWLLNGPVQFRQLRDAFAIALVPIFISAPVAASIGTAARLLFEQPDRPGTVFEIWRGWWVGDALGALVFAPLTLILLRPHRQARAISSWCFLEWGALCLALVIISITIFTQPSGTARPYLLFPMFLWAALRFGTFGTTSSVACVAVLTGRFTSTQLGPYADDGFNSATVATMLQLFLAISSIIFTIVAVVLEERQAAMHALREANEQLDERVRSRTDEALHAARAQAVAEARMQLVTDALPALVSYVTRDLRYGYVNKTYERWFGIKREEIVGKPFAEVIGASATERVMPYIRRVLAGETLELETELQYQTGPKRFMRIFYVPDRSEAGDVIGYVALIQDVSEQHQANLRVRDSEARFRFLHSVADATRDIREPAEVMKRITELLGRHLNVSRCAYADVAADADHFTIQHDYTDGAASTVGRYRLDDFGERAAGDQRGGRTLVLRDIERELAGDDVGRNTFLSIDIRAVICCPLIRQGRLVAMMAVHQTTPRDWTAAEVRLVEEVVDRSWAYIERARDAEALRVSEARFRLATDAVQALIYEWDLTTGHVFRSRSMLPMLGFDPGEVPETVEWWVSRIHPDDLHVISTFDLQHSTQADTEYRVHHKDGSWRTVWDRALVLHDESARPIKVIGSALDITERRQAEEQLIQARDELEKRVEERTSELTQAIAELKRSNNELQQFAYVASHDLQEPLRTITSFTQLLAQRYAPLDDAKAQQYTQFVVEAAARMRDLITDLLAYSRVGARAESVGNAGAALGSALENLDAAIRESNARISSGELPTVKADEGQLCQVFQNLIANALKFRDDSRPPEIDISAHRTDEQWTFRVRDNGIGIAEEHRERIFAIFQRLHARGRYPGSGIGLAICKKIVAQYGGEIWVDSTPGIGSTFSFTLPAADASSGSREGRGLRAAGSPTPPASQG